MQLSLARRQVLLERGYEPLCHIAAGAFGTVIEARRVRDGRPVAIKMIPSSARSLRRPTHGENTSFELDVLSHARHPHIVEFIESFTQSDVLHTSIDQDEVLFIVTELLVGGDLYDRVVRDPLSEEQTLEVARQVLSALVYLKHQGACHRDVKLENIALTADLHRNRPLHVKLLDFGFATYLHGTTTLPAPPNIGTVNYSPPHVACQRLCDPHKSDVWAVGVIMYAAAGGAFPFYGQSRAEVERMVRYDDPTFQEPSWARISWGFRALVTALLLRDEDARPDLETALAQVQALQHLCTVSKRWQEVRAHSGGQHRKPLNTAIIKRTRPKKPIPSALKPEFTLSITIDSNDKPTAIS